MDQDLLKEYLLTAFPNPERKGCPNEETLKALAERRLGLSDPALVHITSCSECYSEYLNYRLDWKEDFGEGVKARSPALRSGPVSVPTLPVTAGSRPKVFPWAVAAGLAVALGAGLLFKGHHAPAPAGALMASSSGQPISANMDLFNAVTVRGGGDDTPTRLEQVSLPSSVVHLTVTLPRFSESGAYSILVAKDRAGRNIVAQGLGNAVEADGKVGLVITLDLRKTPPGMYFLATVRGADNGTYYYPLRVN